METAAMWRPKVRLAEVAVFKRWIQQTGYAFGAAAVSALAASVASSLLDDGRGATESFRSLINFNGVMPFVLLALIVAPLIETLFLAWVILLLLDRGINQHVVVLQSATFWTATHSIGDLSGLSLFIPFVAFSYLFIKRRNSPHFDGFLLAMMAHFYFNLIALIAAFCSGILAA